MLNRDEVKEIVILETQKYAPEFIVITEDMRIVEDLKITGDDDSFLISSLQRKIGVKPPLKAWKNVETIGDVIDLIMTQIS